jgi:hypothetical protein
MARRRIDNTMARRRIDTTMARRRIDNTMARRRIDNTMARRRIDNTKIRGELRCSERISRSYSTGSIRHASVQRLGNRIEHQPT